LAEHRTDFTNVLAAPHLRPRERYLPDWRRKGLHS
jgi:hypothetical protein